MQHGEGVAPPPSLAPPSLLAFPVGCSGSPPLPPTIPCEAITMPGISPPPIGCPLPPPLRVRARPGLFHISVPGLQAPAIVSDLMAPSPTSAGAGAPWAAAHRRRGSPGAGHCFRPDGPPPPPLQVRARPGLLRTGVAGLRARAAIVADLLARHPPWRAEVEALSPKTRGHFLNMQITRFARLR